VRTSAESPRVSWGRLILRVSRELSEAESVVDAQLVDISSTTVSAHTKAVLLRAVFDEPTHCGGGKQ